MNAPSNMGQCLCRELRGCPCPEEMDGAGSNVSSLISIHLRRIIAAFASDSSPSLIPFCTLISNDCTSCDNVFDFVVTKSENRALTTTQF